MLNPYMGYDKQAGSAEGACLIFAHTAKEARKTGFATIRDWFDTRWIDMVVHRLSGEHLIDQADPNKFIADIPHVIDSPTLCPSCRLWGGKIGTDGECTYCEKDPNP